MAMMKPIGPRATALRAPRLEIDTEGPLDINAIRLAEAIGLDHRVQQYKVEGQVESGWKLLSEGTTIGDHKVDRFPTVTVWKVRLTIGKSQNYPAIREFGLYLDAAMPAQRNPAGNSASETDPASAKAN